MNLTYEFTAIPNSIQDALPSARLSAPAREVLDVVFRNTFGWPEKTSGTHKKCHSMAISFFVKATKRHPNVIQRALKELEDRHIIRKFRDATFRLPASWGPNPVEMWIESPCKVRVTVQGDTDYDLEFETVTQEGDTRVTVQGDPESPSQVGGESPSQVTKKEKERNSYRKEIEKNITPLPPLERGNTNALKNAHPCGPVSNEKLSEGEKAKATARTPQFTSQGEYREALISCWRNSPQPPIDLDELSRGDQKLIDSILERSPSARGAILAELSTALHVVNANPGMLPKRLEGTAEGFCHILRNRKTIAKEKRVASIEPPASQESKKLVDPQPYSNFFTDQLGGSPVYLSQEQVAEFQVIYTRKEDVTFGTAFAMAVAQQSKNGGFPGNLETPADRFMYVCRGAQRVARLR